jgi:hypothetical protein
VQNTAAGGGVAAVPCIHMLWLLFAWLQVAPAVSNRSTTTPCLHFVFLQASVTAQEETSEAQMFFTPLKDINLPNPELELTEFTQLNSEGASADSAAPTPVSFILRSNRPAALTQFNTKIKGRFSDDAFTALHPCQPQTITFYPHASVGQLTPAQLMADLTAESLFDHQYGQAGIVSGQ